MEHEISRRYRSVLELTSRLGAHNWRDQPKLGGKIEPESRKIAGFA